MMQENCVSLCGSHNLACVLFYFILINMWSKGLSLHSVCFDIKVF